MGQCLRAQSAQTRASHESGLGGNLPFQQMTFFAFEPPLFFLHQARRLVVKYDILEKTLDFRHQEGQIGYTRCLDEVALETAIAVGRELLRVDAYLQWDGSLPGEPAEQRGGCWRRVKGRWRVAYATTKGRHCGG